MLLSKLFKALLHKKSFLSFLFFFLVKFSPVNCQTKDLTQDKIFFHEQTKVYQKWLNSSGLGQVLNVEEIEVTPNNVSLYLAFQSSDIDSTITAWEKIKTSYEEVNPIKLEQQLFYKMLSLMEIPQEMADVQIYDTYDRRKKPLFFVAIYFEDKQVKVEKSGHKATRRIVDFSLEELAKAANSSVSEINQKFSKDQVFNNIYAYAENYFNKTKCEDRYPHVRLLENRDVLRFEVTNLCREVLTDAANPLLCRLLKQVKYDCNWVKREKLDFVISYLETRKGIRLGVMIDGKYGSGYYDQVPRGGYMNMEIDFDEYLNIYADEFKQKVINIILTGND